MASYSIPPIGPAFVTLPAPTADAWLQPIGGDVYVCNDTTPSKATAGMIPNMVAYPVTSGRAVKLACVGGTPVQVRMWDKT